MHFRDTFEPVAQVEPCGALWPGLHDGLESARPVCVGEDGHEGWHAAPYLGVDPLGTEYRWNPDVFAKDGTRLRPDCPTCQQDPQACDRFIHLPDTVPGLRPQSLPVDTSCICTIDNRTGLIYDREAECPQHGALAIGCTCTHVPALEPTGPTPGLADCSRHAPTDCQCPDELEFHPDCPIHQPAPGQCRWCSGWDGLHALRDCRGKREAQA
jgi:hypothetical protein